MSWPQIVILVVSLNIVVGLYVGAFIRVGRGWDD